jgi:hypothetical protein
MKSHDIEGVSIMTQLSEGVVERVARALAIADGKNPDAPAWVEGYGNRARTFCICWRDQYSAKAEAAIAAYEANPSHGQ